jgi:hypothetical protein
MVTAKSKRIAVGRTFFSWKSPQPSAAGRPFQATIVWIVISLVFSGGIVTWTWSVYGRDLWFGGYVLAAIIGIGITSLLLLMGWLMDRYGETSRITFDEKGAFGAIRGQTFDFAYENLYGFDVSDVWLSEGILAPCLYLFPIGASTVFEWGDEGIVFEERGYENVISLAVPNSINVRELTTFLLHRVPNEAKCRMRNGIPPA